MTAVPIGSMGTLYREHFSGNGNINLPDLSKHTLNLAFLCQTILGPDISATSDRYIKSGHVKRFSVERVTMAVVTMGR